MCLYLFEGAGLWLYTSPRLALPLTCKLGPLRPFAHCCQNSDMQTCPRPGQGGAFVESSLRPGASVEPGCRLPKPQQSLLAWFPKLHGAFTKLPPCNQKGRILCGRAVSVHAPVCAGAWCMHACDNFQGFMSGCYARTSEFELLLKQLKPPCRNGKG